MSKQVKHYKPTVSGKLVRHRFKKLQVIADKVVQLHDVRNVTLPVPAEFIQAVDTQVIFDHDNIISGKVIKQFRVRKTIKFVPEGTSGVVEFWKEEIPFEAFVEAPVNPADELGTCKGLVGEKKTSQLSKH